MSEPDAERSRIANNRLAAAAVVGTLLAAVLVAILYRLEALAYLVPEHGPVADALPLYLLTALAVVALAVWGWTRFLSLLR